MTRVLLLPMRLIFRPGEIVEVRLLVLLSARVVRLVRTFDVLGLW